MPTYSWNCHTCHSTNQPNHEVCQRCGFAAVATGKEIEHAKGEELYKLPLGKLTLKHKLGWAVSAIVFIGGALMAKYSPPNPFNLNLIGLILVVIGLIGLKLSRPKRV